MTTSKGKERKDDEKTERSGSSEGDASSDKIVFPPPPTSPSEFRRTRGLSLPSGQGDFFRKREQSGRTKQKSAPSPRAPTGETIVFPPSRTPPRGRALFAEPRSSPPSHDYHHHELMGPVLRRKKAVSMPLFAGSDFFCTKDTGSEKRGPRTKQKSAPVPPTSTAPSASATRRRVVVEQDGGLLKGVLRRKQVSLGVFGSSDFFAEPEGEEAVEEVGGPFEENVAPTTAKEEAEPERKRAKSFCPLHFRPFHIPKAKKGLP